MTNVVLVVKYCSIHPSDMGILRSTSQAGTLLLYRPCIISVGHDNFCTKCCRFVANKRPAGRLLQYLAARVPAAAIVIRETAKTAINIHAHSLRHPITINTSTINIGIAMKFLSSSLFTIVGILVVALPPPSSSQLFAVAATFTPTPKPSEQCTIECNTDNG